MRRPDRARAARDRFRPFGAGLAAGALGACLAAPGALAQGCALTARTDPPPPREVLACADGLTVVAEEGARVRFVGPDARGRPSEAVLEGGAVLVETPPGRPGRFQIRTPHAVASVRGTVWAADVSPGRTSVFVRRGEVAVARPRSRGVVLRAGDGVDVQAGSGSLEVRRWSPERAAALLGRLGR